MAAQDAVRRGHHQPLPNLAQARGGAGPEGGGAEVYGFIIIHYFMHSFYAAFIAEFSSFPFLNSSFLYL
jgi:hypothetical protein